MTEPIYVFSQIVLVLGILFLIVFFVYSILEKENHTQKRIGFPISILIAFFLLNFFGFIPNELLYLFLGITCIGFLIVFIPFGNTEVKLKIPEKQFDERDIMFSRMELKEGTEKFDNYYKRRPENKSKDDLFRKEPGLLNSNSKYYNPFLFHAAGSTFATVDLLQPLVESTAKKEVNDKFSTEEITEFLKKWTKKLGAVDVGFTLLKPHHVYSTSGRGENYGKKNRLNHKFAIAFTVEMNHESLSYTPKGPIIMESAQQYLNAGTIAVQVAEFIRSLGFDARAHIDANYKLICPVVAEDAGLGTIGRMGLLMTPKLGPRVRIGVITTNLEVNIKPNSIDSTIIHFCEICKKCASSCPSNSIPFESTKNNNPRERWTINQEKCFTYWCKIGTDCGRCVTVCPYSHPNNFIHNIIRFFIRRNSLNRWLALKLDDFFYGKKPSIKTLKGWMT